VLEGDRRDLGDHDYKDHSVSVCPGTVKARGRKTVLTVRDPLRRTRNRRCLPPVSASEHLNGYSPCQRPDRQPKHKVEEPQRRDERPVRGHVGHIRLGAHAVRRHEGGGDDEGAATDDVGDDERATTAEAVDEGDAEKVGDEGKGAAARLEGKGGGGRKAHSVDDITVSHW
jgi:hypothetical protein